VALNSGTDALRLALLAGGVTSEDEVITSPFTFIATGEAIGQVGKLVLADVDPETFTLTADTVRSRITSRTRAVIPVHIFGLLADMEAIGCLAREKDLVVVEDACQAHGAAQGGVRAGAYGDAGAFSFYPSKNLGAFGDAGAVTCRQPEFADRVRLLRNHGQVGPYAHVVEGYNSRMDSFQAALLLLKLPHLERWNDERRRLAQTYRDELSGLDPVRFQKIPHDFVHVYHVLAALTERRDALAAFLRDQGVDVRVVYPTPLHLMEAYRHLGLEKGALPNAEAVSESVLCFPLYPGLPVVEAARIARLVRRFYETGAES
jgi:dTDP-4-amino-4,6-dideoxygalactose transaminase